MLSLLLIFLLAALPTLAGRVADPRGKPLAGALVRIATEDGKTTDLVTDSRGIFRAAIGEGKFHLEIRHDGYRSVRSSTVSLSGAADDVFQLDDVKLLPGNAGDIESVELQLEEIANAEARTDPTAREGLPKSDRLFGLR